MFHGSKVSCHWVFAYSKRSSISPADASAGMCLSETLDANEKRRPDWDAFNVFSTIVFAG